MIEAKDAMKFLRKYGYKTNKLAVEKILRTWQENKTPLLNKFRQHPNWNEDALAIVIPNKEFPKQFSREPINNFCDWLRVAIPKYEETKATEDKSPAYYINKLDDIKAMIRYANKNNKKVEIDGKDVHDIVEENQKEYDDFIERTASLIKVQDDGDKAYFITNEFKQNIEAVYDAMYYIKDNVRDSNITAEQATHINQIQNVNASEGQKLSRVINKLCTTIGFNEYRETQTTRNNDGEEITREVGYGHHFNIMAEGVTSKTYKVYTIISLNPLDFWGMSLLHKVASCHTIDCYNLESRGSTYSGQSSGGTTTLMLDKNTVVFYTVVADYHGNLYFAQDKMNRCLFSISDNGTVMIQHRVYPDARDGGDAQKATYYRNIMQEIVATLWNNPNQWTLKRGSSEVRGWYSKYGLHYDDLSCNSDVTVSLLKDHQNEWSRMNIGVDSSICPVCGRKHRNSGNIMCYDCRTANYKREYAKLNIYETNEDIDEAELPSYADVTIPVEESTTTQQMVQCANCGEQVDLSTAILIDGNYYCDEDCASEAGYHYIMELGEYRNETDNIREDYETEEWHLEENMFKDSFDGHWYYGTPEVTTEDGSTFQSVDNAFAAEYDADANGNWYPIDEMEWDESNDVYVHHDDCIETNDGRYFVSGEDAITSGYREVNGEWYEEDEVFFDEYEEENFLVNDAINIDGNLYATVESAHDAGYIQLDGEWVRENDCEYDEYTRTYFSRDDAEVVTVDGNYFLYETSAIQAGYRETDDGWVLIEQERETA